HDENRGALELVAAADRLHRERVAHLERGGITVGKKINVEADGTERAARIAAGADLYVGLRVLGVGFVPSGRDAVLLVGFAHARGRRDLFQVLRRFLRRELDLPGTELDRDHRDAI